jgi:hypothetical protein
MLRVVARSTDIFRSRAHDRCEGNLRSLISAMRGEAIYRRRRARVDPARAGSARTFFENRQLGVRCDLWSRMTRKKTLKNFSGEDLLGELAERFADQHYRPGMTMSQMELAVWEANGMENPAALRALSSLLARMPLEVPTGKRCPKCAKRIPVKAKDRDRELRTMAGRVRLTRNYHYCETCQLGFYPLDRVLELPEEGELTAEMEKRVLDFALTDVYGACAARWSVHYREPASDNLFPLRRLACRRAMPSRSASRCFRKN